jgi:hypothetical protein
MFGANNDIEKTQSRKERGNHQRANQLPIQRVGADSDIGRQLKLYRKTIMELQKEVKDLKTENNELKMENMNLKAMVTPPQKYVGLNEIPKLYKQRKKAKNIENDGGSYDFDADSVEPESLKELTDPMRQTGHAIGKSYYQPDSMEFTLLRKQRDSAKQVEPIAVEKKELKSK